MKHFFYFLLPVVTYFACTNQQNSESGASTSNKTDGHLGIVHDSVVTASPDTALFENLLDLNSDEDILNRFGKQISHKEQYSSEIEGSWQSTQLFPGSKNEVTFEWIDTENFKELHSITISGTHSDWKTLSGIKLGMKHTDLEQLNGKPFLFYYLGWNFGGQVFWNEGALENQGIHVVIAPSENGSVDPGLYNPQASEQISSDSEAARNSDLIITTISFIKDERTAQ